MSPPRPPTIQELTDEGKTFVFDPQVSFVRWISVAQSLLRQADVYYYEKDFEQAYMLYTRFTDIVVNYLTSHKEMDKSVATYQNKEKMKLLNKDAWEVITKMEKIKPIIEQRVAAWNYQQKQEARRIQQERDAQMQHFQSQYREAERRKSQGISDREYEKMLFDISRLQKPVAKKASSKDTKSSSTSTHLPSYPSTTYKHSEPIAKVTTPSTPPSLPPLPPLKPLQPQPAAVTDSPPPYYAKPQISPSVQNVKEPANEPKKEATKEVSHRIRATTEGGEPLRSVFLPADLKSDFLRVAQPNTSRKLETCGMLCGRLSLNAFFITHLVIPHQESTPDTCATTHEEILFDYLDKNDLILLGWIHTHPTQSCFMSSVDLHTQCSYQIMLKESIAIVCAPTQSPSWDIYRLTDPNGTSIIRRCPKSSFHPHSEHDIYRSSMSHGHVVMGNKLPYQLVDLRNIKPSDD